MSEKKKASRRFRPTYVNSIISIALVLFMVGILAFMFSSGKKLAAQSRERLDFTVIIKDNTDEKKVIALTDTLAKQPWVKSAEYVSKQQAAESFIKESGEDFTDLLDYNPLFASINLKLHSEYTSEDSLMRIEKMVMEHPEVSEFYYERKLVSMLNDNLRKIGWFMIGISIILMVVAVTILDSAIRLSMYAQRLLIRSMQLVGATKGFITKPFLTRSIINGLISAVVATVLLFTLMKFASAQLPDLQVLQDYKVISLIFFGLLITGILFSLLSTLFAVRKYLRMKIEELY